MRVHLIAVGGSIMHNLAIELKRTGHEVSGSDDEIYEPSRSRLASFNLLPIKEGWDQSRISANIDLVLLGMHARENNPELIKARQLGIPVLSFPEYIYNQSINKKRVVITGSHGKTTTTSIILHVLNQAGVHFDFLVGARIEGFENMVRLSEAELIIIEGDEYLSSAIDPKPKICHYKPHICVLTGIAWDHMNVFPTYESYVIAFSNFIESLQPNTKVFYDRQDPILSEMMVRMEHLDAQSYIPFPSEISVGKTNLLFRDKKISLNIFGNHNMLNLKAAYLVLKELGITDESFTKAIPAFQGASRRLDILQEKPDSISFLDFAHAPSKVRATVQAVRDLYPERMLTVCLELHTYSSLNAEYLPQYRNTFSGAGEGIVFYNRHTLKMKNMPDLTSKTIVSSFQFPELKVFTDSGKLRTYLKSQTWKNHNLLMMSSGVFAGMVLHDLLD